MDRIHKAFRNEKIKQNLHKLSYKWSNQFLKTAFVGK